MAAIDFRRYSHRMPKISDGPDGVNIAQSKSALQRSTLRLAPKDSTPQNKIVSSRGQHYLARFRIGAQRRKSTHRISVGVPGCDMDSPHAQRESRRKSLPGASTELGSKTRTTHTSDFLVVPETCAGGPQSARRVRTRVGALPPLQPAPALVLDQPLSSDKLQSAAQMRPPNAAASSSPHPIPWLWRAAGAQCICI